jgi:hypothetical protein
LFEGRAASRSGFLPLSDQLEYFLLLWLEFWFAPADSPILARGVQADLRAFFEMARSNSANEATICIIMRPARVAVSMAKKFNSAAPIYNTQVAIYMHSV